MGKKSEWVCEQEHTFDGQDIIITDPCYLRHGHGGINMNWDETESWCKDHGLYSRNYYGDWGCTVYETDKPVGKLRMAKHRELGEFCADAGMVCVLSIEDARKLNPQIDEFARNSPFAVTVIHNFTGTVKFMVQTRTERWKIGEKLEDVELKELRVRGDGEIDGYKASFESVQTSL